MAGFFVGVHVIEIIIMGFRLEPIGVLAVSSAIARAGPEPAQALRVNDHEMSKHGAAFIEELE